MRRGGCDLESSSRRAARGPPVRVTLPVKGTLKDASREPERGGTLRVPMKGRADRFEQ